MGEPKRISELVSKRVESVFDDIPVYGLADLIDGMSGDYLINEWESVEGDFGAYLHILVGAIEDKGPQGETEFVVTTGAGAIVDKLEEAGKENLPILVKFTKNKAKNGRDVWYNIE